MRVFINIEITLKASQTVGEMIQMRKYKIKFITFLFLTLSKIWWQNIKENFTVQ